MAGLQAERTLSTHAPHLDSQPPTFTVASWHRRAATWEQRQRYSPLRDPIVTGIDFVNAMQESVLCTSRGRNPKRLQRFSHPSLSRRSVMFCELSSLTALIVISSSSTRRSAFGEDASPVCCRDDTSRCDADFLALSASPNCLLAGTGKETVLGGPVGSAPTSAYFAPLPRKQQNAIVATLPTLSAHFLCLSEPPFKLAEPVATAERAGCDLYSSINNQGIS